MKDYCHSPGSHPIYDREHRCIEAVLTCVGFADVLEHTLALNHPHVDTMIVVTSHEDHATHEVCKRHSAICVKTELFKKNGRNFNKGAAINAGFDRFQYHGWRMCLDVDIVLPDNFRRILLNHCHLQRDCLYGATRRDIVGLKQLEQYLHARHKFPQHAYHSGISSEHGGGMPLAGPSSSSAQYADSLRGYCPIGFFQLWHASEQREYPYSLGTACHDDVIFAQSWPRAKRHLLPEIQCYHLVGRLPHYGENWDGIRRQPRLR